jgi:hypothetical protein
MADEKPDLNEFFMRETPLALAVNDSARCHGLPTRGNSHRIICRYGSPLDGSRSIAFLAKGLACSSVCRLSFGSDIHSRMILRRVSCSGFMLNPLP